MSEFYIGACGRWESVALSDPALPAGSKYTILSLAQYVSPMGRMAWPGKKELAEVMGVSENQVTIGLKKARELGYLRFDRSMDGQQSVYSPTLPPAAASTVPMSISYEDIGPVYHIPGNDLLTEILTCMNLDEAAKRLREAGTLVEAPQTPQDLPIAPGATQDAMEAPSASAGILEAPSGALAPSRRKW